MTMTRRASAVLPESNTGEDRIAPAAPVQMCDLDPFDRAQLAIAL